MFNIAQGLSETRCADLLTDRNSALGSIRNYFMSQSNCCENIFIKINDRVRMLVTISYISAGGIVTVNKKSRIFPARVDI